MDIYEGELDNYDPFVGEERFIDVNQQNFNKNAELNYDVFDINGHRFIISNNYIFDTNFLKNLSDISIESKEEIVKGNKVVTLIIDTKVANAYWENQQINTAHSLFSNLTEARETADINYENEIKEMSNNNNQVLFGSPEFQVYMEETFRGGSTLGYKHTPETIQKMKGFVFSEEVLQKKALSTVNATNARKLAVTVKNIKTNETVNYDSLTSAGEELGVSKAAINQAIKNCRLVKKTYAITFSK